MECIFCKIASGAIPVKALFEDEEVIAFADMHPQAPVHVLLIPKRHVASLAHAEYTDEALLGRMQAAVVTLAKDLGLTHGYRTVINTGSDGGQTVDHLHIHVMGGRQMTWPPG